MFHSRQPKVLYVEDDGDDCLMLLESFAVKSIETQLVFASDGDQAIQYLERDASLPQLIILDLNMPRWDGRQTLRYIKSHPIFSSIPVAILSTSASKADKDVCAELGADIYLQKPYNFKDYEGIVSAMLPLMSI